MFLLHEGEVQFSGYGLVVLDGCPHHLVGLLMVDRPKPASVAWLNEIEDKFGPVELQPMTRSGERGLVCHMWIDEASLVHVRQLPGGFTQILQQVLSVLLMHPPAPQLDVSWDATTRLWVSTFHQASQIDAPRVNKNPRLPRFALGQVVATPGALEALEEAGQLPQEFLHRHVVGDWGELDEHDREANERAVHGGDRIFSSYLTKKGAKLWVITEYDRSVTTLLLPSEY
jgi:hypothetical protein